MSKVRIRKKKNTEESLIESMNLGVVSPDDITEDTAPDEELFEETVSRENSYIKDIYAYLKYLAFTAISLVFWEILMGILQGGFSVSNLFFLVFIPAEAAFLTAFFGIGNEKISRITMPIVVFLPAILYIVQTVYYVNFGSLASISLAGMGGEAVGGFGWAVIDSIEGALWILAIILIPVIAAIVLSIVNPLKITDYKWWMHFATIALAVVLWFGGVLIARAFGTERLSPYYLLTNSSATTDASAKKLGVATTAVVECGVYYLGIESSSGNEFIYDEGEDEEPVNNIRNDIEVEIPKEIEELAEAEKAPRNPWINEKIDFGMIEENASGEETKSLAEFFEKRGPSTTNEYTGMFEGYNLIYICAESFWSYGCNEKVTPTLYKMAHNGIVLNNYYNSFYNTTTNGEFAFCTSLWPDVSRNSKNGTDVGSFAQSSTKYMPQGLGDLFGEEGIPSYAFHNYYGKYYRRILSWPNLGYKCRFTGDGMWFSSNWPASDYELMQQTVDDYINDDQFHAYYMTFSGHGPYTSKNYMFNKNIGEVNSLIGEDSMNLMARGYLAGELELDKAMEYLLDRLREAGKLDKTVIVLTGDHYPYYLETEARDSLVGSAMDENFEIYRSNCIIYNAGMDEPMEVNNYCCNVDIAPTMLNLFNIPFDSRLMAGRDIFSDEAHNRATLYNMSFVSDYVSYNYETGEAEWTAKGDELSQAEKDKYIKSQLNSIENEYMASCKVIQNNFFLEAYKTSGLLTEEDYKKEIAREENARSQDDSFNLEDEEAKLMREAEQLLLEQQQMLDAGLLTPLPDGTLPETGTTLPQDGNVPADGTVLPGATDAAAAPADTGVQTALPQNTVTVVTQ